MRKLFFSFRSGNRRTAPILNREKTEPQNMIRVYAPLYSRRKDKTILITKERLKEFENRLDFGK
jgi:hypothetical protein